MKTKTAIWIISQLVVTVTLQAQEKLNLRSFINNASLQENLPSSIGLNGLGISENTLISDNPPTNLYFAMQQGTYGKPPTDGGKVFGELFFGGAAGIGLGYLGARLGASSVNCNNESAAEEFACALTVKSYSALFVGGLIAYPIGTAIGVYAAGNIGNDTGSLKSAILGSYAGLLVGAVLGGFVRGTSNSETAGVITFLLSPPIVATLAFNKSRRYKDTFLSRRAIINLKDGELRFAMPRIKVSVLPARAQNLEFRVNIAELIL